MQRYDIRGMSCAACAARIEKAVSAVDGVDSCAVSLLTNEMGIEGTASSEAVISAVVSAGYGASLKNSESGISSDIHDILPSEDSEEPLSDRETPQLVRRLTLSLAFLILLMYISMGHMMLGLPLPECLSSPTAMGFSEMVLALIVMLINRKFFISGFRGLFHGAPNMDTLVALGSLAGFVFSLYSMSKGNTAEYYFESSAMILTLITVGKMLEARSKGRTTDALRSLMKIAPRTAVVIGSDGSEKTIPAGEVREGDIFAVYAGSNIPVDGVITEGSAAVDESALTGESIPIDKAAGDRVSAATINRSGYFRARATAVGEDTALSQIIRLVSDAAATKAPIAKAADKVSAVFVPAVMTIALITAVVWLILGEGTGFALSRGISVLVISCPCALGLATPVAIMVASGKAAKNGILFKSAASLEETGRVDTVVLDKTGTITEGTPHVTDIIPAPGTDSDELLTLAAALEMKSSHPLAKAVSDHALKKGITVPDAGDIEVLPGNGLKGIVDGDELLAGSLRFISDETGIEPPSGYEALANEGKTPMLFARNGRFLGMIAVADITKRDSAEAISQLKSMKIRVIMLTGDNERTAAAVGRSVGVDEVIAGVLPDEKETVIRTLKENGKVAMIGDGINDAPALTRADVGIAIGTGTDVAVDAADVVLIKGSLSDAAAAVALSRAALKVIHQNLFWAFFYNAIGIPVAAGVFIRAGITLSPMIAAACMSLSSFCVVSNALRLNAVKIYKENKTMTRTLTVDGMMCPHCEARVKKALEAVPGVVSAEASFEKGTAVVMCEESVSDAALKEAVTAQDYAVTDIR